MTEDCLSINAYNTVFPRFLRSFDSCQSRTIIKTKEMRFTWAWIPRGLSTWGLETRTIRQGFFNGKNSSSLLRTLDFYKERDNRAHWSEEPQLPPWNVTDQTTRWFFMSAPKKIRHSCSLIFFNESEQSFFLLCILWKTYDTIIARTHELCEDKEECVVCSTLNDNNNNNSSSSFCAVLGLFCFDFFFLRRNSCCFSTNFYFILKKNSGNETQ